MKKYFKSIFIRRYFSLAGLLGGGGLCLMVIIGTTVGCQKARLFSHIDTLPAVPSQFHFFNGFSYDSSLNFAVDGKLREKVGLYQFSDYYPTSSAFNQDPTQPNGKYIVVSDPRIQTQFYGFNTIQFSPTTSYLVFPAYDSYDTTYSPLNTIVPRLMFYSEDVETPFDGTSRVRILSLLPGIYGTTMTISPNEGAGTSLNVQEVYQGLPPPGNPAASYYGTQPGTKNIFVQANSNNINVRFNYLPVTLDNRNYTFFMVGDLKNFLAGLQPRPRLFMVADGDVSSLKELTLSSITYPGNLGASAQVTLINGAYNIPGLVNVGNPLAGGIQYLGLDADFNQIHVNVKRWPIVPMPLPAEVINDIDPREMTAQIRSATNSGILPGTYKVNVVPGQGFTPVYDQFTVNLEQGVAYSICFLPDNTSALHCGTLIMENDKSPDIKQFRLRVINLMAGENTSQIDIHLDSLTGPLLASAVSYAQATDYISLPPGTQQHNLYVTAVGSSTPLFQLDAVTNTLKPISMPFNGGNSGTLYIMGLLPGTSYAGDPGFFGPYALYQSDAAVNPNTAQPSQQVYF